MNTLRSMTVTIVWLLVGSLGISQAQSGFYMTLNATKRTLEKTSLFDIKVSSNERTGTTIKIFLADKNHGVLKEAVFERRNKKQKLLLRVPIKFVKNGDKYKAKIFIANSELSGAKVLLYFTKAGASEELSKFYKEVPANCFGLCYVVSPASLL